MFNLSTVIEDNTNIAVALGVCEKLAVFSRLVTLLFTAMIIMLLTAFIENSFPLFDPCGNTVFIFSF